MKNNFILFLILICTPLAMYAQENFGIKGSVVDSNGVNIESGNVILLSPIDSTVIKGIHFWEGTFELYGLEQKTVLFKVTSDGYMTYLELKALVPDEQNLVDIGRIQLMNSVQLLDGVDAVFTKPMFEREIGKLIVNVEGTILSERGTIIDLLRSAPNVIVGSDGNVSVVGKGTAIIYLDGQRMNSIELLSSISSMDVSRLEIIESPSARYDAEGKAVIEIITKKGAMDGYQGSLAVRGSHRTDNQLWYRGQFSFRKKWFTMYVSGGQFSGKIHQEEKYHREINGIPKLRMENEIHSVNNNKFNSWLYFDTDYRIDSLNTIFINYNTYFPNVENEATNSNFIFEDSVQIGSLESETTGSQKRFVHSVSAGYRRIIDTLGSDFRFTGQYSTYDLRNTSEIAQITNFGVPFESHFKNDNFNNISVVAGQLDYTKKYNAKINLNLGAKNSYVTNESGLNFQYLENDQWWVDSTRYNAFQYVENILAGYSELTGKVKKISYLAGLRYEWTVNQGNSLSGGVGVVNRNYHNLFPNIQLSYDVAPDLIIGATYSKRISRPSYQDLDPFENFIDSLTSIRGNTQLRAAYTHSAELSLIYMAYASIKVGYNRTKDPIFLTVEKNEGLNTFSGVTKNIGSSEAYTIGLVIPYEWPWWTTVNSFGYDFNKYTYTDNAEVLVSDQPTFYVNLYNEFRFKKLFNIELTYEYVSPGSQGIFIVQPYQSFGGSITRKFFKDQLIVRFNVFDMFYQQIENAESRLTEFNVSYISKSDTKSFMLGLTWNFGKLSDQNMAGKAIDVDEKRRIK